jgi:hypothetical protein
LPLGKFGKPIDWIARRSSGPWRCGTSGPDAECMAASLARLDARCIQEPVPDCGIPNLFDVHRLIRLGAVTYWARLASAINPNESSERSGIIGLTGAHDWFTVLLTHWRYHFSGYSAVNLYSNLSVS